MKRLLNILILFILAGEISVLAQENLVPNPSFEVSDTCPYSANQIIYCSFWDNPTTASPDYFKACSTVPFWQVPSNKYGNQPARSGDSYAGIVTSFDNVAMQDYREYLQVQLLNTLLAGTKYNVSFYVSLCDDCNIASNEIGAFFSSNAITGATMNVLSSYSPQVSNPASNDLKSHTSWTNVAGSFTAVGDEEYLTIGNFKNGASTSFTYTSGSVFNYSLYYIDDVSVSIDTSRNNSNTAWLPNVFSPNGDTENDVLYVRGNNIKELTFIVYNRWGEKVFESKDISYGWGGSYKGEMLNPAVFVYYAEGTFSDGEPFSKKGNVTLVR